MLSVKKTTKKTAFRKYVYFLGYFFFKKNLTFITSDKTYMSIVILIWFSVIFENTELILIEYIFFILIYKSLKMSDFQNLQNTSNYKMFLYVRALVEEVHNRRIKRVQAELLCRFQDKVNGDKKCKFSMVELFEYFYFQMEEDYDNTYD
jgi:hypothetical protein